MLQSPVENIITYVFRAVCIVNIEILLLSAEESFVVLRCFASTDINL